MDVGTAGRLGLVDSDPAVGRSRRQDVERVDDEIARAFVAADVDLARHLAEPGACTDFCRVTRRAFDVVVRDFALSDSDEGRARMCVPAGRAARRATSWTFPSLSTHDAAASRGLPAARLDHGIIGVGVFM